VQASVEALVSARGEERLLWLLKPDYAYGRRESSRGDRKDEDQPSAGAPLLLRPVFYKQTHRGAVAVACYGETQRARVMENWVPVNQPAGAVVVRWL